MFENARVQSSGWPLQAVVAEVARGEGTVEVREREVVDGSGEGDGVGSSASRANGRCMLECYVLVIACSFSCVQNWETSSRNTVFTYEKAIDAAFIGATRETNKATKGTKANPLASDHRHHKIASPARAMWE